MYRLPPGQDIGVGNDDDRAIRVEPRMGVAIDMNEFGAVAPCQRGQPLAARR